MSPTFKNLQNTNTVRSQTEWKKMLYIDVDPLTTRVKISPNDPLHVVQGDYMDKIKNFDASIVSSQMWHD